MTACEACWDQAFLETKIRGGYQADHYHRLLVENEGKPGHTADGDAHRDEVH